MTEEEDYQAYRPRGASAKEILTPVEDAIAPVPEDATTPSPKKRGYFYHVGKWLRRVAQGMLPVIAGPQDDLGEGSVIRPCATVHDMPQSAAASPSVQRPTLTGLRCGGSDHVAGQGPSPNSIRKSSVAANPSLSRRVSCQFESVPQAGPSDGNGGSGDGALSWQRMEALLTRMQAHHDAVVERSEARIMRALQHERLLIQKLLANNSSTSGVESAMLRVMPFYDFSTKR